MPREFIFWQYTASLHHGIFPYIFDVMNPTNCMGLSDPVINFINFLFEYFINAFGGLGLIFSFFALVVFMVIQAILAPIASEAVLSAAGGIFNQAFGTEGIIVALLGGFIGSLLGAITAFYIARWGQQKVSNYVEKKSLDEKEDLSSWERFLKFLMRFIDEDSEDFISIIDQRGFLIVLIGRILPFVPFDAVSYGAGFTQIKFRDFMWATFIGTIPRVFFYVLIGTQLGNILSDNGNLFILVTGVIALVLYFLYRLTRLYIRKNNNSEQQL